MRRWIHMTECSGKPLALRLAAVMLSVMLLSASALAEEGEINSDWVTFFLICNEGMTNEGGNVGSTMMVVGMNPEKGKIHLMMVTWDTFVQYEGYDSPQLISMPYRNTGPDGTMKTFDSNFGLDVDLFMSLNFLNLAMLIDTYDGVVVDVTRAERNALNGMVASKKEDIQSQADSGLLSQLAVELLANESYLSDYGPETHLNGIQAVAFGWLQYDSVYNCCLRDLAVVSNLFSSVARTISERVMLYTNDSGKPEETGGRRGINLDDMSDEDAEYLLKQVEPIFQMSYNNLSREDILGISITLARRAYEASRQGVNIFESLDYAVFPLEAQKPYDNVAGTEGHLVDYAANGEAMKAFLFAED